MRWPVPSPSPIFVGRDRELARLDEGLTKLPVAVIYGVPGVGKSALAYAYAARWGTRVVHRPAVSEPLSALLDDVRRQLANGAVPELRSDEERLADVAARLDDGSRGLASMPPPPRAAKKAAPKAPDAPPSLWILDDLHALSAPARAALLDGLAASLRGGRVIATSRERVPVGPGRADRLELHLGGLDETAASALWRSLDELYGPAAGVDAATARAKGNPFQLRRAHAGGLDDDDPIASALRALAPDEHRVAGALALAQWRLPTAALATLLPGERVRAALRGLVTRLVVDVDGAGTCGIQNLFRDAALAQMDEPTRRELHGALARILPSAGFDHVLLAREITRHLCALERYDDAGRYLAEHGPELVRAGATGELLRGLESIPEAARSPAVAVAHARCVGRHLDFHRAFEALARLVAKGSPAPPEVRLAFGETAFTTGRVAEGLAVLGALLVDPSVPEAVRRQALPTYGLVRTHYGEGDAAREALLAAELAATDPVEAALLAFSRVLSLLLDEREAEAEEPLRRARTLLPDKAPPYTVRVLVPISLSTVLARLGRFGEVDELLALAEEGPAYEDLYTKVYLRRMRGAVLFERGERAAALGALRYASEMYERGGSVVGAWLSDAWAARILLVMGRRREAERLFEATRATASSHGAESVVRAVDRGRALDPLFALERGTYDVHSPKPGEAIRARAFAALRAAADGRAADARALLAETDALYESPGYGLDRAIGHLARATLARLEGRERAAADALAEAEESAAADGVDAELVRALLQRVGELRMVTTETRRAAKGEQPELSRYAVVLDGRSHELRVKKEVISLGKRPAMRRLLYELASRPDEVCSKEALAKSLWSARYNPLTHDNALWVNVRRLRVLLGPSGLTIELAENGYRLRVPERFVYLDPGRAP